MQEGFSRNMRMKRVLGFTLIELMIAVAVIGILAGIAYPSYTEHVRRGRITEMTNELSTMRVRLEQFYQDNRNYGSTAAACGIGMPAGTAFTYSCNWGAVGTNQGFLITATGNAAVGMNGYTFTIDETNTRRTTAFPGAAGLPLACWISKKGETC